jgi:hypothetical protein
VATRPDVRHQIRDLISGRSRIGWFACRLCPLPDTGTVLIFLCLFFVLSRGLQKLARRISPDAAGPSRTEKMGTRKRFKQTLSLGERLLGIAEDYRARARRLQPGKEQDDLFEKAREFEGQIELIGFIRTSGMSLS